MTNRVQYDPRLQVPFELARRISAENYGSPARGVAANGDIVFALDRSMWPFLAYGWIGQPFRVYLLTAQGAATQVNAGRVANLTHDTLQATVSTTDASSLLDDVLVADLYGDDAPAAIQGQPKPQLWGEAISLEPVLEDDAALLYRISRAALALVLAVRVGGIAWDEVAGSPGPGQYSVDLTGGTITLGGVPGGEVRVDARAVGWETATAAALIRDVLDAADVGVAINETVFAAFDAAAPYLIGFYANSAANRLDVLDALTLGVGGWWGFDFDDNIIAGVIDEPGAGSQTETTVSISSLALTQVLPPAWRIRVEHTRNWQPASQFFDSVSEADQQAMSATGITAAAFEDDTIKTGQPRAVDVPLVRLLVNDEADALDIRDRLARAWGIERRLYDMEAETDDVPDLYDTVGVDYQMVTGNFRAHGVSHVYGGGPAKFVLWGTEEAAAAVAMAATVTAAGNLLLEDGGFLLTEDDGRFLLG